MLHAPILAPIHAPQPRCTYTEARLSRQCPECLNPVDTAKNFRTVFCCPEHRLAFHDRQLKRGRSLVVPAIADRLTRGGSRRNRGAGIKARQRKEHLIQQWIEEDRAAGRMAMDEYYELTERLGLYN